MSAGTITLALHTAAGGLLATQSALGTVSDNVANANTEGYSRKIVQFETNILAGVGVGVNVADVQRAVNEELLRDVRDETMDLHKISSQTEFYNRMQELFGSPGDNSSIAHTISELNTSMEMLSVTPERSLEQSEVVRWAENVALQLQDMTDTLQDLRKQADDEIHQAVLEIDNHLGEIADLNHKIVRNDVANQDISSLLDKRDQSINELSKLVDITYFERSNGEMSIFTKGGTVLVDQESIGMSHNRGASVSATTTHEEGDFSGVYVGSAVEANDITDDIQAGQLKGLIEMRDTKLQEMQAEIDHLAAQLRDNMNAVHNRGVAFPGLNSLQGSTAFLDSSAQKFAFGSGDTRLAVMDGDGNQVASVSLSTQLTTDHGAGPWTLDNLATTVDSWLDANAGGGTASFVDGKLQIELSNTDRYLSMRDQTGTGLGDAMSDATVNFYADGTNLSKTHNGFSDFFGLNDFYTDDLGSNIFQTGVLSENYTESGSTLTFYDDSTGSLNSMGSVPISGNLENITSLINSANIGVRATLISEGDGKRLRITNEDGHNMNIVQDFGSFVSNTDFEVADVRTASSLKVRSDISSTPGNISRGILRWDASLGTGGEYYVSAGDNYTASAMAETFNSSLSFDQSGGLSDTTATIHQYASSILSLNSSHAANNELDVEIQEALVNSLTNRSDSEKGVNLDEELSQLILYEQAYAAAARVISVIQSMFDTLEGAVR
ncbi:flagellar hook-associated protein FlgK [Terasakiella sp. SH-1]|uniref:flagellar hook-associated protein FlgK n=1 Tax=Terasakiella sp. SH-1 TaxID=2560057 RepID=UPI001073F3C3|nr:flagellar hook-associated protein FlgK [Terasakiella sp. SH-1]